MTIETKSIPSTLDDIIRKRCLVQHKTNGKIVFVHTVGDYKFTGTVLHSPSSCSKPGDINNDFSKNDYKRWRGCVTIKDVKD